MQRNHAVTLFAPAAKVPPAIVYSAPAIHPGLRGNNPFLKSSDCSNNLEYRARWILALQRPVEHRVFFIVNKSHPFVIAYSLCKKVGVKGRFAYHAEYLPGVRFNRNKGACPFSECLLS